MTSTWDADGLSQDAFLGGRLSVWQPVRGYRAGIDPLLLAAAVTAVAGESVLELGCGAGVASLCLGSRVPGLLLAGVEVQAAYAELARLNADANDIAVEVVNADLTALPGNLRARSFDHVMMNPPYFDRTQGTASSDTGRDVALGGGTPLAAWVDAATKRLVPGGWLTLIQRTARLSDVLASLDDRVGSVTVWPVAARTGRAADLFLLRAKKGGHAPFRMLFPLLLHGGDRHLSDAKDYTPAINAVLRDGAGLVWAD